MNKKKLLLIIIPLLLFALLAVSIKAGISSGFEEWSYNEVIEPMSTTITSIWIVITYMGNLVSVIGICLILLIIKRSRQTIALPVSITVIVAAVLNFLLKNIFARQRPDILRLIAETNYSFPSGHAMVNCALYTSLIFCVFKYFKSTLNKIIMSMSLVTLTVLIGFSRVYLGVHYITDVLGGWLLGFVVAVVVYFLWERYNK